VTSDITDGMAKQLARDKFGVSASCTADRAAQLLRTHIMDGLFPPGTKLAEEAIGHALGVSRNTLREAFKLLCHDRLAVHQMNCGIFVPVLSAEDVTDLFRLRRLVEGWAARLAGSTSPVARQAVMATAKVGAQAAASEQWPDVRNADVRFHQALAALAASPRVDELMRQALGEFRLIVVSITDQAEFDAFSLTYNLSIAECVIEGDGAAAEVELLRYLNDAECRLLALQDAMPAAEKRRG
jgi:DNA-binding GntR family transcriptional regulator